MVHNLSSVSFNRLVDHLRNPLYRNGYALVLNSAFTSGLGLLYWIFAARYYSPETLGLNSAVLSTIMFLASIAQFNMVNTLNRFVPSAGPTTGRLILFAYGIGLVLSIIVGVIFVFGIDVWAPALSFIKRDAVFSLWFVCSVAFWCIFAMQDSVLIGLRKSVWVLIENTLFAVSKLLLLVVFASFIADYGVWASWAAPIYVAVIAINFVLFFRWIPRHIEATRDKAVPLVRKQIAAYIGGDYIGQIFWIAAIDLLPLLVTERVSPTANAYFYLSWTISYSLYLVSRNMGMSLTTEAALDQKKLNLYGYQTLIQTTRMLVPLVIVMFIGAPYVLQLLGQDYAEEATTLLRLLTVASLPAVVTSLFISIARVQRRVASIILVQATLCIMVLGLSFVLLDIYGIVGVGLAWLGTQTLVASLLLMTYLRPIWLPNVNVSFLHHLTIGFRRIWWRMQHREQIEKAFALIPEILPLIPEDEKTAPSTWTENVLLTTLSDVIIIHLGPVGKPPEAWLKVALTPSSIASLKREHAVLDQLHQDPRLATWNELVPKCLISGDNKDHYYLLDKNLSGVEARNLHSEEAARKKIQIAAAATITEMHNATATVVTVNEELLNRWVDQPIQMIREVSINKREAKDWGEILDRLSAELHGALENRTLTLSWTHGDFWAGNILMTPDGSTVTGIIDWENAVALDWPVFDIMQLLISSRTLVQKHDLNAILWDILEGEGWTPHEQTLLENSLVASPGNTLDMRTMVILSWLNHVAANLSKTEFFQHHWLWITKNVHGVLNWL